MNNTVDLNTKRKFSITDQYQDIAMIIAGLGHIKPGQDSEDPRLQKVWNLCLAGGYTLKVIKNWDLVHLATHEDPHYAKLQNRINTEGDVKQYQQDFYVDGIRQDRIIWGMEIGGVYYVFIGNKRVQAHKLGISKGEASRCHILMVNPGNISDEEKVKIAFDLAILGNKKRHTTRDIGEQDYVHQLQQSYIVECGLDPARLEWDDKQKIDWAKGELVRIDSRYAKSTIRAGVICSQAFSSVVGQVLPFPTSAQIAKVFKQKFPRNTWDESSKDPLMLSMSTHKQSLMSQIEAGWEDREKFSSVRTEVWLALRTGKTKDAAVTVQKAIEDDRCDVLSQLRDYNLNVNHAGAGHPQVSRILFLKQTTIDEAIAYEWNAQTKQFDKV